MIDKRIILIKEIYALHTRLVDVHHQSAEDKTLLGLFCKKFVEFTSAVNPTRSSSYFSSLFKPTADLNKRNELSAHLLAASQYAALLTERTTTDPELPISNEIVAVIFDYAQLLKAIAIAYQLPVDNFTGSRNIKVDANTSFKIATQFFWHPKEIQRSNTLNGFTIFALRQALESGAKELLGLKAINKANGKPDHYTSQIPWQFLVEFGAEPYFKLPFHPAELQIIYKWSNHFVHSGTDTRCYITAIAIKTVEQLFQRIEITNFYGEKDWVYANLVSDDAAMKTDFAEYLMKLKPYPLFPEWRPNAPLAYVTN